MSGLLDEVAAPPEAELVVAVSGGADSAFLAWAMAQLARPRLVHIDHQTPGASDLRYAARRLAEHLDLPLQVETVTVPAGPSWEALAREQRRTVLRRIAAPTGVVATGHHRDDQVETILGNLIRGAGATGLSGMVGLRDGWFKPLLGLSRQRIRAAVAELGLPFADDASNQDTTLRRNLLRHQVIPQLERINPGVSEGLLRTARHLAADDAALESLADAVPITPGIGSVVLPAPALRAVDEAIARRVVRRALRCVGDGFPGTTTDVDGVMAVVTGHTARTMISGGVIVETASGTVVLWLPSEVTVPGSMAMRVPGTVSFGDRWIAASGDAVAKPGGARRAVLSARAIGHEVTVRTAQPGDRIDIGRGSKLIVDALAEGSVPVGRRSSWPVVEVHGRIAWLVGVRSATWAAPDDEGATVTFETGEV